MQAVKDGARARVDKLFERLLVALGVLLLVRYGLQLVVLAGLPHPELSGWGRGLLADARFLAQHRNLFVDPSQGASGHLGPPLMAWVTSLLWRVVPWDGWPQVVNYLASWGCVLTIALSVWQPLRGAAAFWRGLAWGGVAIAMLLATPSHFLFVPRVEHLAWFWVFAGLAVAPTIYSGASRACLCALLFALGFWTKQNMVFVPFVVAPYLALQAWRVPRRWPLFALCAVSYTLLLCIPTAIFQWRTDGWFWQYVFVLPTTRLRHITTFSAAMKMIMPGVAFVSYGALLLFWRRATKPRGPARTQPDGVSLNYRDACIDLVALTFLVAIPFAAFSLTGQGSSMNHINGVMWLAVWLTALVYEEARTAADGWAWWTRRSLTLAPLTLGAAAAFFTPDMYHGTVDSSPFYRMAGHTLLGFHFAWSSEPQYLPDPFPVAEVRALTQSPGTRVYHPDRPEAAMDAAVSTPLPHVYTMTYMTAMDQRPDYLRDMLLQRDFAYVAPHALTRYFSAYASSYGLYSEGYFEKLDFVMHRRYVANKRLPGGLLERRADWDPAASWEGDCFGPYTIASGHTRWEPTQGGGFWCQGKDNVHFAPEASLPTRYTEIATSLPSESEDLTLTLQTATHPERIVLGLEGEQGRRVYFVSVAEKEALDAALSRPDIVEAARMTATYSDATKDALLARTPLTFTWSDGKVRLRRADTGALHAEAPWAYGRVQRALIGTLKDTPVSLLDDGYSHQVATLQKDNGAERAN